MSSSVPPRPVPPPPVVALDGVVFRRGGTVILDRLTWCVGQGERWVVVGPNGAGKTTALRFAAARELPVEGSCTVLGERVGRVDLRRLRRRIGYLSPELAAQLRPTTTALDVVVTGFDASLLRWRTGYSDAQWTAAHRLLERFGCGHLARQAVGTLSEGERQRVLLARALVVEPALLLLDEPSARLDLLGREQVVAALSRLPADRGAGPQAVAVVTHHLEEVPPGFTHALLIARGRAVAAGPVAEALTDETVSACFGAPLQVRRRDGRWEARLRTG